MRLDVLRRQSHRALAYTITFAPAVIAACRPNRFARISRSALLRWVRFDNPSPPLEWIHHIFADRRRRALLITDTELKVIAALARTGLSSNPKNG